MKLLSVSLKNFLSHVDTKVVFDDKRPYLFIGVNGSGKSSLVKDSVTYALFGKARGEGAGDDLIRGSEKECVVTVGFSVNGINYEVSRTRVRNKSTELKFISLTGEGVKDLSGPTATTTQKEIEKVLGFDNDIFSLSACLEQGGKLNFSELTPKMAKDVLLSVLRIDRYNDYEKETRCQLLGLEKESAQITGALEHVKKEIESYSGIEGEVTALNLEKELYTSQIEKALVLANNLKDKLKTDIGRVEETIGEWQVKQLGLKSTFDVKNVDRGVIAQQLQNSGQTIVKLREKLKRLGELGGKCSQCGSVLTPEHLSKEVAEVQKEIESSLAIQEDLNIQFKKIQDEIVAITNEGNSYNVMTKQAELKNMNKELSNLMEADVVAGERQKLASIEKTIAGKQERLQNSKEKKKSLGELQTLLDSLLEQQKIFNYLLDAFGKNGIPAIIISNMVFEMEYSINGFLRRFSDRSISVKLVMEKELKVSKGIADTFEIIIRDGIVERPYQLYSGGEKFRIDLSIRLALAKILARRNNFTLETLILDEPAFLDKRGLASLKDILAELSGSFSRIFVVSHLTELIEDAGNRFNVVEVGSKDGASFIKRRSDKS